VSETPTSDFLAILRVLQQRQVEFVVVGGIGAVLQGAPITTFDLVVVHSLKPGNVERLSAALEELDAVYRAQPDRRMRPGRSHLESAGHQLLLTRYGPLDLLGEIGQSREFSYLADHCVDLDIGGCQPVRVLDLETLVQMKEETGRERDLAALPVLRRTLAEKRKRRGAD